jgi:hypothetical protein
VAGVVRPMAGVGVVCYDYSLLMLIFSKYFQVFSRENLKKLYLCTENIKEQMTDTIKNTISKFSIQ